MNIRSTHNNAEVSINGTHLQGYIDVPYSKIVAVLGKPLDGDYKTDWEWHIVWEDGLVSTLYNYKNGPNYGYGDVNPQDIRSWNVGGHDSAVLQRTKNLFQ